jgi:aspartyl-tRNA(Asn)/glutamyl-tRNA(Gln) amidotransferase subunit C
LGATELDMSEKFQIEKIAKLARLHLTPSESERLNGHLETIIQYIDKLEELDTTDVEPTSHVIPLQNVFRQDKNAQPFAGKDFIEQSPSHKKGHYEVPQII